jgi:hypothetical protein
MLQYISDLQVLQLIFTRIRCLGVFVFESTCFRLVHSSQSQAYQLKLARQRRSTHLFDPITLADTKKLRGPQNGTINVRNWRANISYIHSCLEASTDHLGIRIARVSRAVACSSRAPRCSLSCAACHPPSDSIVPPTSGAVNHHHHAPSPVSLLTFDERCT